MPKIPKNFARLTAGLKKTPPPLSATFLLGMKKFQRTLFVFGGFAPYSFFSSYPICGSSSKKQRGDEQSAYVVEAAWYAYELDAPAYEPKST